jgi:hypothetical protein
MELVIKNCDFCKQERKFIKGTPRDERNTCGDCWDWEKEPSFIQLNKEDYEKLIELLSKKA